MNKQRRKPLTRVQPQKYNQVAPTTNHFYFKKMVC